MKRNPHKWRIRRAQRLDTPPALLGWWLVSPPARLAQLLPHGHDRYADALECYRRRAAGQRDCDIDE